MKDKLPSDSTVTKSSMDSQHTRIPNQRPTTLFQNKLFKGMILIMCLALGITVYVLAHKSLSKKETSVEYVPPLSAQALEIEVLDGVGNMRIAQQVTNRLRVYGYDVVEMKKNMDGMVERSYVIDRCGKLEAAQKLAEKLGIPTEKVFQKIDRTVYLDMTVVVGRDYSKLKVFQTGLERSSH